MEKNTGALGIGKPLVDRDYLLDKFPGMGGWTYTIIPEIAPDPHAPFGWVKVKGTVDGVEIRDYHLLPGNKGSGVVFLSVKADLRKKIKKEAGDTVRIVLWRDDDPLEVPEEFLTCLAEDAAASEFFDSLKESDRQAYIKWIYSSKKEETKIDRMAKTLAKLSEHKKITDK